MAGIDWSQFDLERELRGLNEEQKEEKLGQITIIKEMEKRIKETMEVIKELEKGIKKEEQGRRQREERR